MNVEKQKLDESLLEIVKRSKELPLWQKKIIEKLISELIQALDKEKKVLKLLFDREQKNLALRKKLHVAEKEQDARQRAYTIEYGALARETKKYREVASASLGKIKYLESKKSSLEGKLSKFEAFEIDYAETKRTLAEIQKEYSLLEDRYTALSESKLGRIQKKSWQYVNNTKGPKK